MRVRAVLFDYGMVLSGPADESTYHNLIKRSGLDQGSFDRFYWSWRNEYDSGRLDGIGYWSKIAKDSNQPLDFLIIEELIAEDVRMWSNFNAEMVEWSQRVKTRGLMIGILSNICLELASSLEHNCTWLKEFDHLFWSCKLRMTKPDPALFEHVIQILAIPPNEVLFLDDRSENVAGAKAAGMQALQFSTLKSLQGQIRGTELEAALNS